jgi:transcriptional regulator with XRE-family HTH domain
MSSSSKFDVGGLYEALESVRVAKGLTWKKMAEQSGVSASTLTRLSQGRRPDVDSLAALCQWSHLPADQFVKHATRISDEEPLERITAYLRADPNLSEEAVVALNTLIRVTYERLRKERK